MFRFDRDCIDKSLPVPPAAQLRGLISYLISNGELAFGTRLPSVRELAGRLGLASKTVHKVYQQLNRAGLIEMRRGAGAFVARDPRSVPALSQRTNDFRHHIDVLIDEADGLGLTATQLMAMIGAQMQARRLRAGLRIAFVGIFDAPTQAYVDEIRPFLAREDSVEITTIDRLTADPEERARLADTDLVLTFVNREHEVKALLPDLRVLPLRFIPAEATRLRLAAIDPRAQLAAVTRFQEYIAIMRPSIRMFAPHLSDIVVTCVDAPDLAEIIRASDVVVYATGADGVAELCAPRHDVFEYRHAPDRGEIVRILQPLLVELRMQSRASEPGSDRLPAIDRADGTSDAADNAAPN